MNKITALMLLLVGLLTEICIVSAQTDKSTRNLRGWDQEQEFISLGWNGGNPGECSAGVAWRNCGRGATCWRTYRNGNWNGNGICVPNDQCLPGNTWALNSAVSRSTMNERCCNGAVCSSATGKWDQISPSHYCRCLR